MLSLVADAKKRFGFDGARRMELRVRICRADERPVTIFPAATAETVEWMERQIRHVRWNRLPADAVVELVFSAATGHPRLLVNGQPDADESHHRILDELGPAMYELMRSLAEAVSRLPSAAEFREDVLEASAANLRAALTSGSAAYLRPGARRVVAACPSCREATTDGELLSMVGMKSPVGCGHPFTPFVEQVYEAAGATVLRQVEGAQMRRLRADLAPILEALDAYPVDVIDGTEPSVSDAPILSPDALNDESETGGGIQMFVLQF